MTKRPRLSRCPPIDEMRTSELRRMAEGLRDGTLVIAGVEIEKAELVDQDEVTREACEPMRLHMLACLDAEIATRKVPRHR